MDQLWMHNIYMAVLSVRLSVTFWYYIKTV